MPNSALNPSIEASAKNKFKESSKTIYLNGQRNIRTQYRFSFISNIRKNLYYWKNYFNDGSYDNSITSIWDYASLGTLLRNIMDALNSFLYLADRSLSTEEKDCRFWLFSLHDAVTRQKIFEFRGVKDLAEDCKIRAEEMRELLCNNSTFQVLEERKQKHYLKGADAFLLNKEQIIKSNGGNSDDFLGLYKFLSANAHSYPMGFFKMGEQEFGKGIHSRIEESYTEMILCLTASHLDSAFIAYENYLQSNKMKGNCSE